ncbi:transposase [Xylanimonas ulmi]|uniref:Transposase n=1 Tax=Xylanimonas ulmi TaxID=228973 RepID=A0A4Q7M5B5_9MICO|nr:transposase [Xylanibacterium ulmi]RZS62225.1 transposase [Xylanibacterium ulmi]RZS62679.1 transposase [Xylanibacterium ulmi]
MENWAEIRRLHRSEGVAIKEIARRLGIARNTVRAALASDRPPQYERAKTGSVVDAYEPAIRSLLLNAPRMSAPEIASRINWPHSMSPLKKRLTTLRPQYVGLDPSDRTEYEAGDIAQCDLWFPDYKIPVGPGQEEILPVLAMTLGFSKMTAAVMIPTRKGGDILAGMWNLIRGWGKAPRQLVWDREAAIGGRGKPTVEAASFAGTLGVSITLAPAVDPEFKGGIERRNKYFETSFLPGRTFTSPQDFNTQFAHWLETTANVRRMRVIRARPIDLFQQDLAAMVDLPPIAPMIGLTHRVRLGRDYYVRIDSNDYSVDPRAIGRFVDIRATADQVIVTCDGQVVADHTRSWARELTITDPEHREIAKALRHDLAERRKASRATRTHADGHVVAIRALPEYDALFGVDFDPRPDSGAGSTAEGTR